MAFLKKINLFIAFVCILILTQACDHKGESNTDRWMLGGVGQVDSVEFKYKHHYWKNDIFYTHKSFDIIDRKYINVVDSSDVEYQKVEADNEVAILDVFIVPNDTIVWNYIATDVGCAGWVKEEVLLENTIPNNAISKFIFYFSDKNNIYFSLVVVLSLVLLLIYRKKSKSLKIPIINDVESFYPTLLCLCVAIEATIYGTMQRFAPEVWVEYYFNPTLNPFSTYLPLILIAFITGIWLLIITLIAVIEDLTHQFNRVSYYIVYLSLLMLLCVVLYIVFSLSVHIYIGYPLLLAYIIFAFWRHKKSYTPQYRCGKCGAFIAKNGKCHECNTNNILD